LTQSKTKEAPASMLGHLTENTPPARTSHRASVMI
jgi:hypothetical protein